MNKTNTKSTAQTTTGPQTQTKTKAGTKPKKVSASASKAAKAPVKLNSTLVNSAYWGACIGLVGGVSIFNTLQAQEYSNIVRLVVAVVAISLAAGSFVLTNQGRNFIKFGLESLLELRKIYWPTRKEALVTALIVTAISVLVSFMFFIFDAVINQAIHLFTKISF